MPEMVSRKGHFKSLRAPAESVEASTRIVDENINLTGSADNGRGQGANLSLRRQVGPKKIDAPPRIARSTNVSDPPAGELVSTDQNEVSPQRRKPNRRGTAHT